jgi:hypothetical protein
VTVGSRLRWKAALYHRPAPPSPGKHQRRLQAWAARPDTARDTVEVDWYGGRRKNL